MNLILQNLNEEQKKAVTTTEGPVLVLSGAGTGKTSVLTARVAYILEQGLAEPWQIMALTFTNKAAAEMKSRIDKTVKGFDSNSIWCGTFHSLCLRILRRYFDLVGLPKTFSIFDETSQKSALKYVFEKMGLNTKDYSADAWVEKVSLFKMGGEYKQPNGMDKKIFDEYNTYLASMGALDFDDIIIKVLELFEKSTEVLEKYQKQFKYVMVDEYQDTSFIQSEFINKISAFYNNLCCVGDDDQSIYSWRGAQIENILGFDKRYPNSTVVRLTINYRSTANILGAANSVIGKNLERMGKDLKPADDNNIGEPVCVFTLPTDWMESALIAKSIIRGQSESKYSDFAVLVRTATLFSVYENEFVRQGIPYRVSGGPKIYERSEIKDTIAYIKLLFNKDDNIALRRAISNPRRGFGDVVLRKLGEANTCLFESLKTFKLSAKQRSAADEFLSLYDFDYKSMEPFDVVNKLLKDSGYLKFLKSKQKTNEVNKVEILNNFVETVKKSESLEEFIFQISLHEAESENISGEDKVNLMTMHSAKGLEFNTVFLPAWEETIFPNQKALEAGELEEERRLAYVSITRAKKLCIITNTATRTMFGKPVSHPPSIFISEIDKQFKSMSDASSYSRPKYEEPVAAYNEPPKKKIKIDINTFVGKQVVHEELGKGVVIAENGAILTIAFNNVGIKNVAKNFVEIT